MKGRLTLAGVLLALGLPGPGGAQEALLSALDRLTFSPVTLPGPAPGLTYSQAVLPQGLPAGTPQSAELDSNVAPADLVYSRNAAFPVLAEDGGGFHIPWRDNDSGRLQVTAVNARGETRVVPLPVASERFLALTLGDGHYYYAVGQRGQDPQLLLVKADLNGRLVKQTQLPIGINDFDTWVLDNVHTIAYARGEVALSVARFQQKTPDGLNHQSRWAAVFDASTLERKAFYAQLAGHSMDTRLIHDGEKFLSLDLGDNYPRGVALNRFDSTTLEKAVVFTFKTKMEPIPSPYVPGLPAGRWSNDNQTYTELGDVVPLPTATAVLLSSERGVRNEEARGPVSGARNLALILATPALPSLPVWNEDIPETTVLSRGEDSPAFNFFDFQGNLRNQRQRGVIWLTDYRDAQRELASHPKLARPGDGRLAVLWELWTATQYVSTYLKILNPADPARGPTYNLGTGARLNVGTPLTVAGNQLVWATPETRGFRLHRVNLAPAAAPDLTPWFRDPLTARYRLSFVPKGRLWTFNAQGALAFQGADRRWNPSPWTARQLAFGLDGSVWKLGTDAYAGGSRLSFWNGLTWVPVDAGGVKIQVDASGVPLVLDDQGRLRQFFRSHPENPADPSGFWYDPPWPPSPGRISDFALDPSGNFLWRSGPGTEGRRVDVAVSVTQGPWQTVNSSALRLAVDGLGVPWTLNAQGRIFRANGPGAGNNGTVAWNPVPGTVRDLMRGSDGQIYGLPAEGEEFSLLRWTGAAWEALR